MNGIKMSDCKFYVDEDARVIVCVIPNVHDLLQDFISQHFSWGNINVEWAVGYQFNKQLEMPNSFMGKAVCAPEDEWDVELGKKIAFSRAKDKCYKSFFKRANLLVQTFDKRLGDMIETFNNFGLKLEVKREALESQIEGAIKKEGDA
jgi:hypothetical protein